MTVVRDSAAHAVGPARGHHSIALGDVERHRLLAENVFAGFGGRDRLFGVEMDGVAM